MIINNITELKEYILNNELSKKQIKKIVFNTLRVIFIEDYSKVELVDKLEKFYYKYPSIKTRPSFLENLLKMPD